MILDTPHDHPIQVTVSQKFFKYFLSRPSPGQAGVGKKFFEGIVNSLYFGRVQTKLKSIFEHYQGNKDKDDSLAQGLADIFKAYHLWTEDSIVMVNLILYSLVFFHKLLHQSFIARFLLNPFK